MTEAKLIAKKIDSVLMKFTSLHLETERVPAACLFTFNTTASAKASDVKANHSQNFCGCIQSLQADTETSP
jgi:hypothetical protein